MGHFERVSAVLTRFISQVFPDAVISRANKLRPSAMSASMLLLKRQRAAAIQA